MLSPLPSVGDHQLRYLDCSFSTKHNSAAHSSASFCCLLLIGLGSLAERGDVLTMKEDGPELLVQLTEEYGLETVESNVTLEAVTADNWEAGLLEIPPNTPILALSGVDLGRDQSPVAFSRTLCRSDQLQFSFRLVRDDV